MSVQFSERCTGCGTCVKDCVGRCITIENGTAKSNAALCIECGHCVAVCPAGAVSMPEYGESGIAVKPEEFLKLLRMRRSTRQFEERPVEREKLLKILDAGRVAPTACNYQRTRFIVVEKERKKLLSMALDSLAQSARGVLQTETDPYSASRAKLQIAMDRRYREDPDDLMPLMFNAPAVILIVTPDIRDGGIASAYMELEAISLGLGALYNGYISRSVNNSKELQEFLGIREGEVAAVSLLVGYPAVKYYREAPRKPLNAEWK